MFNPARTRVGDHGFFVTQSVTGNGFMFTEIPVHVIAADDDEIVVEHDIVRGTRWTLPADGGRLNDDLSASYFKNNSAELRKILWPHTTHECDPSKIRGGYGNVVQGKWIFDRKTGIISNAENTQIKEIKHDAESKKDEDQPQEKTGDVR